MFLDKSLSKTGMIFCLKKSKFEKWRFKIKNLNIPAENFTKENILKKIIIMKTNIIKNKITNISEKLFRFNFFKFRKFVLIISLSVISIFVNSNVVFATDTTPPSVNISFSSNPVKVGTEIITATYSEAIQSAPTISIDQPGSIDVSNQAMTIAPGAVTWTSRTPPTNNVRSVTYGNGIYVVVGSSGTVVTSTDGITWTQQTAAESDTWQSVTYGNGLFVAVASDGTNRVMTSPDGVAWTSRSAAEANQWQSVAYGNGLFVAVSLDGTNRLMTSPDGVTWTAKSVNANTWKYITYGNNLFVAVSSNGTNRVMTSSDGITWTPRNAAAANQWFSVTYGNNLYVAVSYDGTNRVMTSPDGITWTSKSASEANQWTAVTYGNGLYVAVANSGTNRIMTSPDGTTWTARLAAEANNWNSIAYGGNGLYVAIAISGTNRIMTSPAFVYSYNYTVNQATSGIYIDGKATVSLSTVLDLASNSSTTPTNNTFTIDTTAPTVAFAYSKNPAGAGVNTISANYSEPITSTPNISIDQPGTTDITSQAMTPPASAWTIRNVAEANQWISVVYGNGVYVAVSRNGTNRVMTSPNGVTWTARSASEANTWNSITYGNGLFVAVANGGSVMTSPDGITWTARSASKPSAWYSVTFGNNLFVAVSSTGSVMTSPDGITWTTRTAAEANYWDSVVYGNGLFVAVAYTGTHLVMTSPDGITWTARNAAGANEWQSVAFGNGMFVAVADNGTNSIMSSVDGITWTGRGSYTTGKITYGNGLFVSVTQGGDTKIMTSFDGINWTTRVAPSTAGWSSVTYGNGLFVAVSYGSTSVITSPASYSYNYTVIKADGSNYIDGTTTVSLSSVNDLAGNASSAPTNNTFEINTAPPTVALSYSKNPANSGTMTITATYNKQVVSAPNISIDQPGSVDISSVAMTDNGNGKVYTYSYTVNQSTGITYIDGTATVSLSSVLDADGNTSVAPTNTTFTIDTVSPTASITYSINHAVKAGDSQIIMATFNEPMADTPKPKISISGASTLSASDMTKVDTTHYTYTYTVGAGNGTATIALDTGTDIATNIVTSAPTSGATFTVDNILPTGTINAICSTNGNGCTTAGNNANPQQPYSFKALTGTSADTGGTGVGTVEVSVKDTNTNYWYNGTALFNSSSEVYSLATGTSSWSYDISGLPLTIDHVYNINVRVSDLAINPLVIPLSFKFTNSPPTVSNVSASEASDGTVSVTYDVTDIESAQTTNYLFYKSSTTLNGTIADIDSSLLIASGALLPSSGTIMIDDEIISYSSKENNTLSGLTRGASSTTPFSHTTGATIYVYANSATGNGIGISNKGIGKSISWLVRTDANGFENATGIIRVVANDGSAGSMIGSLDSASFHLDAKKPDATITFDAGVAGSSGSATITIPMPSDISSIEYRIHDDSTTQTNPVDTGWISMTESTTIPWTFDSDIEVKTLKYQFRDNYGNILAEKTVSTHMPVASGSFMVQDTSNVSASPAYYDLYIGWQATDATGFASYKLEQATSTDNITYGDYTIISSSSFSDVTNNYYVYRNLYPDLFYRFRLGVVDSNGNVSVRSNSYITTKPDGVQNYGEGGGGSVLTASKVENVTVSQNSDKTVIVNYKLTDTSLTKKVNPSYEGYLFYNIGVIVASGGLSGNSLNVSDASKMKSSGYIQINNEVLKYTGKSGNTLTGIVRGTWPVDVSVGRTTRTNPVFFTGEPVWIMANGTTPISITNTNISIGQSGTITWNTFDELNLAGYSYSNVGIKVLVHDNQDALSGPLSSQNDYTENGNISVIDLTAPVVSFTEISGTGSESTTPAILNINLARTYPLDTTISYTLSGTATSGSDYTLSNGTSTITAGTTSSTILIPIVDDTLKENDETIIVTLSNPVNAILGTNTTYTYTITDNDNSPIIQFTPTSSSGTESISSVNIPVLISTVSGADITVDFTLSGTAINGTDYNLSNGTVTIPAGQTTANIVLPVLNDKLKKENTTVIFTLSNPTNATLGTYTTYTYTISNDNSLPTIGFTTPDSTGLESVSPINIPVSIPVSYPNDITVDFTLSGTAINGTDYNLSNGTVTIPAGQTTANIVLPVLNDKLKKENTTVIFTLSNPTNATLGTYTTYTYTISNDNSLPTIGFTTPNGTGVQSISSVDIPISIPDVYSADVSVSYTVTGGTAVGGGVDYTLNNGTIIIPAGQTSANITATIINSVMKEPTGTIIIALSNPVNAVLSSNTIYTYTIIDNHEFPNVEFANLTSDTDLNSGNANIAVSISSSSSRVITVDYNITGGTAVGGGVDYILNNGTVTIPAGQTTTNITIVLSPSNIFGPTKTIILTLSNPTNSTLGINDSHVLSILNNNIKISDAKNSIKSTSAVISWTTADYTDSLVEYGTVIPPGDDTNIPYNLSKLKADMVLYHSVYLGNLIPETKYYYKTTSTNLAGVQTISEGDFTTTSGPVISVVTSDNVTDTTATISWTTDIPSTSYVAYSTNSDLSSSRRSGTSDLVTTHIITLTGLTSQAEYYYSVESTDGNTDISEDANNGDYYNFETLVDKTPPIISGIAVPIITSSQAAIVWTTNELADGMIQYGITSGTYDNKSDFISKPYLNHIIELSGLTENTTYYYVITSNDTNGNESKSEEKTFITPSKETVIVNQGGGGGANGVAQELYDLVLAENTNYKSKFGLDMGNPVISNIQLSNITAFGAIINFETDHETIAFVDYGKTSDYADEKSDSTWGTTHTVKLTGLSLGTDFSFKIKAMDRIGNLGYSDEQKFKTKFLTENLDEMKKIDNVEQFQSEIESTIASILPSLIAPFIDKPVVSDITENSATISFRTNVKAFPIVKYTTDANYDSTKDNPYDGEISDTAEKALVHSLVLINLKSNTKYHFIAEAFSLPQVVGKSDDVIFTTQASKIKGQIIDIKKDSFTVVWTTDESTSSIVEYKDLKTGRIARLVDDTMNTSHSTKIENLTNSTSYDVTISGVNAKGNTVEGSSVLSVKTSTDVIPPVISNLKVDSSLVVGRSDKVQTIISWTTDEPSTSTVYYEEGSGSLTDSLANKQVDAEFTKNHVVILASLKAGTVYRFAVESTDDANNVAKPPIRTIITPKKAESIFDVIFKNFDDTFNFMNNVK